MALVSAASSFEINKKTQKQNKTKQKQMQHDYQSHKWLNIFSDS